MLILSLALGRLCAAQESRMTNLRNSTSMFDSGVAVIGQVKRAPGTEAASLMVEISDPVKHSYPQKAVVSVAGDFQFSDIAPGMYVFRVLTMAGTLVTEKLVELRESVNQVEIALPVDEGSHPGTGTVSIAQLLHKVPNDALKVYNNALKAVRKKDDDEAIELMEKAVAIDPQFVEAQTNLGRLYLQKHEPNKILDAFGKVLKIDPRSEVAYVGSSIAFLWLNRFADAETSARQALQVNPASLPSHYFLGVSLAEQDKDEDEAVQHLNRCSEKFPDARIKAAEILARRKDFSAATEELQDYLKSGSTEKRDEVSSWIKELKRAQTATTASR
jgi:tetratricopeptide (TPR) repeat protein